MEEFPQRLESKVSSIDSGPGLCAQFAKISGTQFTHSYYSARSVSDTTTPEHAESLCPGATTVEATTGTHASTPPSASTAWVRTHWTERTAQRGPRSRMEKWWDSPKPSASKSARQAQRHTTK